MSTVSFPDLISAAQEPAVGFASKKSAVDQASSNSFGTAMNKALPSKSEPKKAEVIENDVRTAPGKTVAESKIQESSPLKDAEEPVPADDSTLLTEALKPPAPVIGDETDSPPEVAEAPSASLPTPLPEGLLANQQAPVSGLAISTEKAKDFKPADNSVGSSVLASIQMSKKMEHQKGATIPLIKEAPKAIVGAAEVTQGLQGNDQTSGGALSSSGTSTLADTKLTQQSAQAVPPNVETTAQSANGQSPQMQVIPEHKASSGTADINGSGVPTASQVTAQLQTQAPAPTQPTTTATLTGQVGTQEWNKGFGQQVVNMHLRGNQTMELNLHPQDLGPISITLKLSDASQAHAQFFSHSAQVRSAIEQALPQLREAMAEQGISLGQTSVGDQRQQQSSNNQESHSVSSQEIGDSLNLVEVSVEKTPVNQQVDGQISTYA